MACLPAYLLLILQKNIKASWCQSKFQHTKCVNFLEYTVHFITSSFNDLHNQHTTRTVVLLSDNNGAQTVVIMKTGRQYITASDNWMRPKCKHVNVTNYKRNHAKLHVLSLISPQHNTSYIMFSWTFLEVYLNSPFTFVQSITQTTGKLFVSQMYWTMLSQFSCCIETLRTFYANIRLHSFMSWSGLLKQSEQCLHEYGFASVWIRTWRFSSMWILNN